jgi:succinate-semialdehyde dehydrogenase/glutarate-semialdehyde dehydrogenase
MSLLTDLVARDQTGLSMAGEWRTSSDGGTFDVLDPATAQPLTMVANGTADDAMDAVEAASAAAPAWSATTPQHRSELLRQTFELMIAPFNFPASMATRKIAPAIAAGCTMVLKPASDTPLTALAIAALLSEAGLPDGVLNVLPSRRSSEIVPEMLGDDRVRLVSFTGSTETGRRLLAEAAKTVVNTSMELGGNAPFLVFGDADIECAVAGAMIAKMRNGGQSCVAANRFLVHEAVVKDFSTQLTAAMGALSMGPGLDPGAELGPLINSGAQRDMAESVEISSDAGSSVVIGGNAPNAPGFFFEPTVLTGVDHDDPILHRELFGPIAPITTFASDDEAIVLANDTIHGLAGYAYSQDLARSMRVSEALEYGMVGINRGFYSDPAAPFGGVKQSGIGREGSHEGMMEFLETKYIAADR